MSIFDGTCSTTIASQVPELVKNRNSRNAKNVFASVANLFKVNSFAPVLA
jgi:hypothetical protein